MRHSTAPETGGGVLSVGEQALQAQAGLMPYALGAFGVSLPAYLWAGTLAPNAGWMSVSFAIFTIGWGGFYAVATWVKRTPAAERRRCAQLQLLGGMIWAASIAQVALFAEGAGPFREALLLTALAAALVCTIFAAPWSLSLMTVAPAALAGPLIGLLAQTKGEAAARFAWGGALLALALGVVVNRTFARHFVIAAERERLAAEQTRQRQASRRKGRASAAKALGDELAERVANDRVVA